jgi:nucleoredoxin
MKPKAVSSPGRVARVLAATVCWLTWSGGLSFADTPTSHMASLLQGKLVTFANGALRSYDDSKLAKKKYFGLYYSASWCSPCRTFTPELVSFYKQMAAAHPDFEIVFVSSDETPGAMERYMKLDGMPWAALRFERKPEEKELTRYCGGGIPDLVIVDGNGRVLSDSFLRGEYIGPYKPMVDLARLLTARQ